MRTLERAQFDHVGFVTEERHEGETFVEVSQCWVTNPRSHPLNVEYLRFEASSLITGKLRTEPHIAYRVQDLNEAMASFPVLFGPFGVGEGFAVAAFVEIDGIVVEFMQYTNPDEEGWF